MEYPVDVDVKADAFIVSIDTGPEVIILCRFRGKDAPQSLAQALERIRAVLQAAKAVTGKRRASLGDLRQALRGIEAEDA